jgi:signal transduction histidine kinase
LGAGTNKRKFLFSIAEGVDQSTRKPAFVLSSLTSAMTCCQIKLFSCQSSFHTHKQDIAQTVRSTLEPLAADKKLAFKVEMAGELPPGHGDGRRLTQVLINLVGNGIKFTDAGEVAIKAEANDGSFYVAVRDTGPAISAADQAKLFQEFQQADNAITRKKGGTGLGLAISKRIIEMHGGRIWVESQPGQGSTFTFTLPVIVERQVEAA